MTAGRQCNAVHTSDAAVSCVIMTEMCWLELRHLHAMFWMWPMPWGHVLKQQQKHSSAWFVEREQDDFRPSSQFVAAQVVQTRWMGTAVQGLHN